jgi:proteasome lid subunit RPN8/RPN11
VATDERVQASYIFAPRAVLRMHALMQSSGNSEFCGFLTGHLQPWAIQIEDVLAVRNADTCRHGFAISDEEARRARCEAARLGLQIVAVVHSHPSGSLALSPLDRECVLVSDVPWVVVVVDRLSVTGGMSCVVHEAGTGHLLDTIFFNRALAVSS